MNFLLIPFYLSRKNLTKAELRQSYYTKYLNLRRMKNNLYSL